MTSSSTSTPTASSSLYNSYYPAAHLPPPSFYENNFSYKDQWSQYRKSLEKQLLLQDVVIFDAVFCFNIDNNDNDIDSTIQGGDLQLVACASNGCVYVWEVPSMKIDDDDDDEDDVDDERAGSTARNLSKPLFRRKLADGVLYKLQLYRRRQDSLTLLIVAGDDGVLVYNWKNIIAATTTVDASWKNNIKPLARFQPYPSPGGCYPEVNDFIILNDHLYAAAGDSFGCYKWNLETLKLVTICQSPTPRGYLHAIKAVPEVSGSKNKNNSRLFMTGGEDGILAIWDALQDKLIDQIDMNNDDSRSRSSTETGAASSSKSTTTTARTTTRPRRSSCKNKNEKKWISSLGVRDENWWNVAGGRGDNDNDGGGFVASFYAPTRSLVTYVETRETPQQLAYLSDNGDDRELVSVANESVVTCWHPVSLERRRRVSCSPPSAYALAVAPDGRLAVGGVGGIVDLLEQQGTQQTLRFTCARVN